MTAQLPTVEELVDNFAFLDDWEERYSYLIDLGRKLPPLADRERSPANKVEGCMSQVWMVGGVDPSAGTFDFRADSDSHIVRGLIAVLRAAYAGKAPADVAAVDVSDIFDRLGLAEHLSPNRRNGFYAMVQRIQDLAKNATPA